MKNKVKITFPDVVFLIGVLLFVNTFILSGTHVPYIIMAVSLVQIGLVYKILRLEYELEQEKQPRYNNTNINNIIYDVENFNRWFKDPHNNAIYAHSGIYLRVDKLSHGHVIDYIQKVYNINVVEIDYNQIMIFYEIIRQNWRKKLKQ